MKNRIRIPAPGNCFYCRHWLANGAEPENYQQNGDCHRRADRWPKRNGLDMCAKYSVDLPKLLRHWWYRGWHVEMAGGMTYAVLDDDGKDNGQDNG